MPNLSPICFVAFGNGKSPFFPYLMKKSICPYGDFRGNLQCRNGIVPNRLFTVAEFEIHKKGGYCPYFTYTLAFLRHPHDLKCIYLSLSVYRVAITTEYLSHAKKSLQFNEKKSYVGTYVYRYLLKNILPVPAIISLNFWN